MVSRSECIVPPPPHPNPEGPSYDRTHHHPAIESCCSARSSATARAQKTLSPEAIESAFAARAGSTLEAFRRYLPSQDELPNHPACSCQHSAGKCMKPDLKGGQPLSTRAPNCHSDREPAGMGAYLCSLRWIPLGTFGCQHWRTGRPEEHPRPPKKIRQVKPDALALLIRRAHRAVSRSTHLRDVPPLCLAKVTGVVDSDPSGSTDHKAIILL